MMPIDSPWVVSYLTSIEPDPVSLTVVDLFGIKHHQGFPIENALEAHWRKLGVKLGVT